MSINASAVSNMWLLSLFYTTSLYDIATSDAKYIVAKPDNY